MGKDGEPVVIYGSTAGATAGTHAGGISIRQVPWREWMAIAIDQERQALAAREEIKRLKRENGNYGEAMEPERHASMIAIAAAAFAIEAFYNEVEPVVSSEPIQEDSRSKELLTGLRLGFTEPRLFVTAASRQKRTWDSELAWLFGEMRDNLVYAPKKDRPATKKHPLEFGTSYEAATYEYANATRAVTFATDLIYACVASPAAGTAGFVGGCSPYVEDLKRRRSSA